MANDTEITVTIRKWSDYKGRGDVKMNSWFRCSNRLLEDPDFFEFTSEEILAWIYILSLSSQKNSDTVTIKFAHADRVCRLKKSSLQSAIKKLTGKQLDPVDVTDAVRGRNVDGTRTCATGQDKTGQDIHTAPTSVPESEPEPPPLAKNKPMGREKISSVEDFRRVLGSEAFEDWRKLYPDEYVSRELAKAVPWLKINPKKNSKTPTGWLRFMNGWLERGWDSYQRSIPTNRPSNEVKTISWEAS